jgi:hypothetical protein
MSDEGRQKHCQCPVAIIFQCMQKAKARDVFESEVGKMKAVRVGIWLLVVSSALLVAAQTQEFSLKVLELKGSAEVRLPDREQRRVKVNEQFPAGTAVRTDRKSMAILVWLPYKARVKLAPETEVQLMPTRALSLQSGRIWVGTPPPPMGERRFPLPVQCKQVQIVGSPEAIFSVACQPDGTVTISVDQGSVVASVGESAITVPKLRMIVVTPQNVIVGPMPLTKNEQLMWDMGGVR